MRKKQTMADEELRKKLEARNEMHILNRHLQKIIGTLIQFISIKTFIL